MWDETKSKYKFIHLCRQRAKRKLVFAACLYSLVSILFYLVFYFLVGGVRILGVGRRLSALCTRVIHLSIVQLDHMKPPKISL